MLSTFVMAQNAKVVSHCDMHGVVAGIYIL